MSYQRGTNGYKLFFYQNCGTYIEICDNIDYKGFMIDQ